MKRESKILSAIIVIVMVVIFASGCSTVRHKYLMRGQVLDASNGEVYLCIGTEEGAAVGQVLPVYRFVKTEIHRYENPKFEYMKEKTGTIKITEVVDHYAKAKVISGTAEVNSIAETER